ncbi:class E sortase, partial [Streptomyces sp. AC154]|uniref:class E sortase n=1 Tax=Streptomyces sp. AC154 TaxID=3143184 RepID=UPI003F7F31E7
PAPAAPSAPAASAVVPPAHDETVALRTSDTRRIASRTQQQQSQPPHRPEPERGPEAEDATEVMAVVPAAGRSDDDDDDADAGNAPDEAPNSTGGRAERRRAAKGRGRRRGDQRPGTGTGTGPASEPAAPAKPMSRVEARRAARAAKDSPAVVVSRVVGELFISLGVLMLLFVTYQLWWTNVRADQIAGNETHKIQDDWASGKRAPGMFEAGQGFAIIHIPKLDVVTPIAEGTSKEKVLDRGMVGHYGEKPLRTAMPSDKQGNFALAGHRNTHGEPFRYINRLKPGDPIVVETQDAYYTYEMTSVLPQTSPSNVSVIGPVPPQSGFTKPGRYITLTTCTPEFTSTYRMIVWGKMVDERPRSKGKPDVLVD